MCSEKGLNLTHKNPTGDGEATVTSMCVVWFNCAGPSGHCSQSLWQWPGWSALLGLVACPCSGLSSGDEGGERGCLSTWGCCGVRGQQLGSPGSRSWSGARGSLKVLIKDPGADQG